MRISDWSSDVCSSDLKKPRRRQPLKATPEGLERSALYYLERYDSSSGHLRRLLRRKIQLSARVHGTDPEAGRAAVETLIARLTGLGLRSEEHTSELQSLMRSSYAGFCLNKQQVTHI